MTADDRIRLIRVKIERANKHLQELESAVIPYAKPAFHAISVNRDAESGNPFLDSERLLVYGPEVPAIAGDVAHNLRCALDHLAYHLVIVGVAHGEIPPKKWQDIQFPISHSPDGYEAAKRRRIQGVRGEAIQALDALKPYKGGNEPLWLLSKLDNADKHSFILPMGSNVIVAGVSIKAYEPYFASLDNSKDDQNVNLASHEPPTEPAVGRANALIPTLHKLSHLVSDIVEGFRPLLASPPIITRELTALEEFDSFEWFKFPDD